MTRSWYWQLVTTNEIEGFRAVLAGVCGGLTTALLRPLPASCRSREWNDSGVWIVGNMVSAINLSNSLTYTIHRDDSVSLLCLKENREKKKWLNLFHRTKWHLIGVINWIDLHPTSLWVPPWKTRQADRQPYRYVGRADLIGSNYSIGGALSSLWRDVWLTMHTTYGS